MSVALQIRDVPDDVRAALAAHAAAHGQSLQAFLLELVSREARTLRNVDLFLGTAELRIAIPDDLDPVALIRQGRDQGFEVDRDL